MCGIAGKIAFGGDGGIHETMLTAMAGTLRHRGPDAAGVWSDGHAGLVSTRLAVIDLSDRGRQPMASEDGRLRIVFNGEIYNFQELRAERANGRSRTEARALSVFPRATRHRCRRAVHEHVLPPQR